MINSIDDKYFILNKIGNGSFGKVFVATDLKHNHNVVVKVIGNSNNSISENESDESKIKREINITKQLVHPNIVKILDVCKDKCSTYIIYPHIDNSLDLSKINIRSQYDLLNILKKLLCICDALDYMHAKNIVHRDVKPDNIVITPNEAILIDFNLAAVVNDPELYPSAGYVGSPYFMAPELFRCDEINNYFSMDIYSYGVVLYFISNKKTYPYSVDTLEDLEYAILYDDPNASFSPNKNLDQLIMKIINKFPENRPTLAYIAEKQKLITLNRL